MGNTTSGNGSGARAAPGEDETDWPPSFPHRAIDSLLARLEEVDTLEGDDAAALLGLIAKEAQRLRATVVRLSASKLTQADREARAIVLDALDHADSMKSLGLSVLDDRLDEAERLHTAMREAFQVELRAARRSTDTGRRAPVTRLRPREEHDHGDRS